MTRLLRRLRGLLGTAVTWAIAWVPIRLAISLAGGALAGAPVKLVLGYALFAALQGGFSGLVFGSITMIAEHGRSVKQIRPWRAALWGMVAAVSAPLLGALVAVAGGTLPLVPAAVGDILVGMGIGATLGAVTAGGNIALARRAERPQLRDGDVPRLPQPPAGVPSD